MTLPRDKIARVKALTYAGRSPMHNAGRAEFIAWAEKVLPYDIQLIPVEYRRAFANVERWLIGWCGSCWQLPEHNELGPRDIAKWQATYGALGGRAIADGYVAAWEWYQQHPDYLEAEVQDGSSSD